MTGAGYTGTVAGGVAGTQKLSKNFSLIFHKNSGQTRSSRGGNINFIRYEFVDQFGKIQIGTSSGYSGRNGENILVEYCSRFPSIHRVAGEGKTIGYEWRWPIGGFGLFLLVAGVHWWWSIWKGRRPPNEQKY